MSALTVLLVLVAACGQAATPPPAGDEPAISAADVVPLCSDVKPIAAPAGRYADTPVYVGNEMPVDEVRAWASTMPGYEDIWIDRDHNGWVTVAFSAESDIDAIQADLAEAFPGAGVVAVAVERSPADLSDLQHRIGEALADLSVSTWTSPSHGVVGIGLGVLSEERLQRVEELFGGEPVCVEGADPSTVPAPGPQAVEGDGWRLLVDEAGVGFPYRTGIAWDEASLADLWRTIGIGGDPPPVDFDAEVVVWFGAVYSGSCPAIRLDDVIVDDERSIVHALIVSTDIASACTADANPRAYVVAVERTKLPAAPFAIQLGEEDPPAGVPEERTVVDADLRTPGSVAGAADVHGDPALPPPQFNEVGDVVEPGFDTPFRMYVHCGVRWLGVVNDVTWRADVADEFIPEAWLGAIDGDQYIEVTLHLTEGPAPELTLTRDGVTVVYQPTSDQPPGCD